MSYEQNKQKAIRKSHRLLELLTEKIATKNAFSKTIPEGESPFDPTPEILRLRNVRKALKLAREDKHIPSELLEVP